MKLHLFVTLATVAGLAVAAEPGSIVAPGRMRRMSLDGIDPAGAEKRQDGRDFGTWVMNCQNAAGACNNACYYQNCVPRERQNEPIRYYYDNANQDKNRKHSGCQFAYSSSRDINTVCKAAPFSQMFNDRQTGSDSSWNCDEWPMAAFRQADFDSAHVPRNTLRCMPQGENSSGGRQFANFRLGQGPQPERTPGLGAMNPGDFFTTRVDLGSADPQRSPFCFARFGTDACINDGYEFHMTGKKDTGAGNGGSMHFAYNPALDNTYAPTGEQFDIEQCSVIIDRNGDNGVTAEFRGFDGRAVALPVTQDLTDAGAPIEINGPGQQLSIRKVGREPGTPDGIEEPLHITWHKSGNSRYDTWDFRTTTKSQAAMWGQWNICRLDPTTPDNKKHIECLFPCHN